MAYDEYLADRIRALVGGERGLTEQKMFGGLAFLIDGNMSVSASGQGGLLLRVDPEQTDELLAEPTARIGMNIPSTARNARPLAAERSTNVSTRATVPIVPQIDPGSSSPNGRVPSTTSPAAATATTTASTDERPASVQYTSLRW